MVGDTAQLASPEVGGMLRLLAHDHGYWKLTEVRRMAEPWEQRASLKVRDGDISALPAYRARGRIYSGPRTSRMTRPSGSGVPILPGARLRFC